MHKLHTFLHILGRGQRIFENSVRLITCFIADLSTISNLNVKLIISTLGTEQRTFHEPHFAYILVTFLFTSNTHFQVRHMHFFVTFAFSNLFLKNQVRRIRLSKAPSLHITPLPHLLTTARLAQSVECWSYVDQQILSLNPSQAKSLKIFGAIMLSLGNLVQFIGSHL